MVCKKSVFPQIILITQITTCSPLPCFFFFFSLLDVSLHFLLVFFFFLIGLVLRGGGKDGVLGFFCLLPLPGEFLACFLMVKTTFFPLLFFPSFLLVSFHLRFWFFSFVQATERRYFLTHLGIAGGGLGQGVLHSVDLYCLRSYTSTALLGSLICTLAPKIRALPPYLALSTESTDPTSRLPKEGGPNGLP